jgi:hypothetical protein
MEITFIVKTDYMPIGRIVQEGNHGNRKGLRDLVARREVQAGETRIGCQDTVWMSFILILILY